MCSQNRRPRSAGTTPGTCSPAFASFRQLSPAFASFRQLVRWLAEQDLIPVPKNLLSRDFGFKLVSRSVKTFSDAEVKLLLSAASERTRLYMLLMLNCGMTQGDVAELPKTRIDLAKKQITHKRYKTEDHDDVSTVTYKLWDETATLLRKHLNRDRIVNRDGEPLALVSAEGKPLLSKSQNAKGQLTKKDAIRSAYNRAGVPRRRNQQFRTVVTSGPPASRSGVLAVSQAVEKI